MPEEYLANLSLFVNGITICLQEVITLEMSEEADNSFKKLVKGFQHLYGKEAMNYNIHLLIHITKTVINWGPLFAQSTFPFENENRLLLQNKKSYYKVSEQIVNKKLFWQHVPLIYKEKFMTAETEEFCKSIRSGEKLKKFIRTIHNVILIGLGKNYNLEEIECDCLKSIGILNSKDSTIKIFNRILYKGFRITSNAYKRAKKTNNSCCEIGDDIVVVRKILFLKFDDIKKVIVLANPVQLERHLQYSDVKIFHISYCKDELGELRAYDLLAFKNPVILSQQKKKKYVLKILKGCFSSEH